ncbi:glycoside hydrolase family 55 protein [Xylaria sp. CBS 124048]|nr:glycoside hydrolase family 55 protein [Xylaria sp. CBS 124048]
MWLKILATSVAALQLVGQGIAAAPGLASVPGAALQGRDDSGISQYWVSTIERQGVAAFAEPDYKVFRNVKDYGAKGDGTTDDTDAINKAVTDGPGRCLQHCDSGTTHPAIVYFPSGTYLVSKPIIQTYYTQFVGDALHVPTIKGSTDFSGMGVIDANPYDYTTGMDPPPNWYINQNNFFRQVRNFIIDMTEMPIDSAKASSAIHWQVAQATSLQNIVVNMNPATSDNYQKGLFLENGSGGFMTDLVINGGGIGADIGSQQFTTRNLTFNNCNTAIHMIWDWVWLMQGVTINGGQLGINMTGDSYETIKVGSLLLLDSKMSNVPVGISTLYKPNDQYTNNTLILDNVDMSESVPVAVQYAIDGTTLLKGNQHINGWIQGRDYTSGTGQAIQMAQDSIKKPEGLLASNGEVFTRTKPQYETVPARHFVSVKSAGAAGDGKTDDTAAIQTIFDNAHDGDIIYFDHGAYLISDTIHVPKDIKITGEMWPLLMATGTKFVDPSKPVAVFEVGKPGDVGNVEISDLVIETKGALPGAILMEWNLAGTENGAAGMWDVHFRVGGTTGTDLQSDHCSKNPNVTTVIDDSCKGTFLMLHLTKTASAYIENSWFWVADHELDREDHNQINIYNGRGVLIESQEPVWLWGTASEHSVLYNYQISNAKNTFIGIAQTETAYMQGNPDATQGVTVLDGYDDPNFKETCLGPSQKCARTWGMRITNSSDILVLGAGMYSFFDNYTQDCVGEQNCQDNMISIENSQVDMYGISTKASVNMLLLDGKPIAQDKDNRNTFCAAIAKYESNKSGNSGSGGGPGEGSSSTSSSSLPAPTTSSISCSTSGYGTRSSSGGVGDHPTQTSAVYPTSHTNSYSPGEATSTTTIVLPSSPHSSGTSDGSAGGISQTSESPSVSLMPPPAPTQGPGASGGSSDNGSNFPVTVTVTASTPGSGGSSGSGQHGGNSVTITTITASAPTQGSGGSGGSGSGHGGDSVVTVTVTETFTAVGTCPTP